MSSRPTNGASNSEAQDQLTELTEHARLMLAQAALDGLTEVAEGRLLEDGLLDQALTVVPPKARLKD
ncbi:hypothetical protein [Paucibacter sp. XJ19-41]|uniref:hypothetical protein n=1 Tax=Paucibacter sp. XJ19-41 TaxID=2927824 RepID=UPI00234A0C56|nr:hypothetical protein [Paucibacter sp. XJ19-41]MDC6168387.1 hypothetical protein [Paucibacter sp. XJ19-41]